MLANLVEKQSIYGIDSETYIVKSEIYPKNLHQKSH